MSDVYPELVDSAFWRVPLNDRMARFAELRELAPFLPAKFVTPMPVSKSRSSSRPGTRR